MMRPILWFLLLACGLPAAARAQNTGIVAAKSAYGDIAAQIAGTTSRLRNGGSPSSRQTRGRCGTESLDNQILEPLRRLQD